MPVVCDACVHHSFSCWAGGYLATPLASLSHAQTGYIDYAKLEEKASDFRPRLIIAGGSAYPREWDYARLREIAGKLPALLPPAAASSPHTDPCEAQSLPRRSVCQPAAAARHVPPQTRWARC